LKFLTFRCHLKFSKFNMNKILHKFHSSNCYPNNGIHLKIFEFPQNITFPHPNTLLEWWSPQFFVTLMKHSRCWTLGTTQWEWQRGIHRRKIQDGGYETWGRKSVIMVHMHKRMGKELSYGSIVKLPPPTSLCLAQTCVGPTVFCGGVTCPSHMCLIR